MADVFISHSSKDKVIADKMCEALEARGLKCWIAPRDITPGSEWAVAISDAIATIKVMVVIYSANSAASTQVPKELGLADKRGKFIIPYKIDDMELTGAFDYYLAGAHWIVADIQAGEYKFEELYGVMNGVMQVPLQNITNNTYIDKVTIHTTVEREPEKKGKSNRKWFIPIGILTALLLVMVVLLVSVLNQSGKKQENEREKIVAENKDQEEASMQDFVYEIKDGEATIVGYKGQESTVIIPSEIEGAVVTYIGEGAFYEYSNLEKVEIPKNVVGIGAWAFSETNLQEVTIPASVVIIGEEAFCRCSDLGEVRFFDGLKEIGRAAFAETAVKDITIPDSVVIVGDFAFSNCMKLTSAVLPNGLEKVASNMFNGCINLQQINIPKSVRVIGEFAFAETNFETITIADTNIVQIGAGAFSECTNLKYVELPTNLRKLDEGAFQLCYNLETVVIPEDIRAICDNSFYDSKNVKVIKGANTYGYETYVNLVTELSEKLAVNFQYEVGEDGVHITKYLGNEGEVIVPAEIDGTKVTAINQGAFANCENMFFLSIPYSVQRIESDAFAECLNLNIVAGGELVTELGEGVYCSTSILEAGIPKGPKTIGYALFYNCQYLTSVHIMEGVETIDELAFAECKNLTELRIPYTVEQIAKNAFDGSENLTLIYKGKRYSYKERHKLPIMVDVIK